MQAHKKAIVFAAVLTLFLLTRIWILLNPAYYTDASGENRGFSDVKHYYERYANNWRYGLTPYFEHLYEYPPLSIPILYLPLEIDQRGIGTYYQNYRVGVFIFDVLLFTAIVATLFSLTNDVRKIILSSIYYIFAGLIARNFLYEGLDLYLAGTFTLGLVWWYWRPSSSYINSLVFWIFLVLSSSIKLMTLPLILPFLLLRINWATWKHEIVGLGVSLGLFWGIPLLIWRSSLSVFVIFNAQRPVKYGAFGTWFIELINDFTKSEHRLNEAPDFPMIGPVSATTTQVVVTVFLLSMLATVAYLCWYAIKSRHILLRSVRLTTSVTMTLFFFFVLFLTTKTFSSPFHVWYIPLFPLLVLIPYSKLLPLFGFGLFMPLMDTTDFVKAPQGAIGVVPYNRFRDLCRFLPMIGTLVILAKMLAQKSLGISEKNLNKTR